MSQGGRGFSHTSRPLWSTANRAVCSRCRRRRNTARGGHGPDRPWFPRYDPARQWPQSARRRGRTRRRLEQAASSLRTAAQRLPFLGTNAPLRLAAAHHKSVALVDVAVLVQKRNVRRVHIAFPVLKRCAGVIHMSVRQHKRNGQIGTFAYKRFQTAYACKTIDKQRFFTAFNQIAKLAAQTADLRNIVKNLSACKNLDKISASSVNLRLCRLFIKRLPSAPLSCVFRFYYTISLKKCL